MAFASIPRPHVSTTYSQGDGMPGLSCIYDSHDLPQASSQPLERGSVVPFLGKETGLDGEITYPL